MAALRSEAEPGNQQSRMVAHGCDSSTIRNHDQLLLLIVKRQHPALLPQ